MGVLGQPRRGDRCNRTCGPPGKAAHGGLVRVPVVGAGEGAGAANARARRKAGDCSLFRLPNRRAVWFPDELAVLVRALPRRRRMASARGPYDVAFLCDLRLWAARAAQPLGCGRARRHSRGLRGGRARLSRHFRAAAGAEPAGRQRSITAHLPYYALRTTLRMFAALAASLVFTFTYATLAAKSRRAEMVLIPAPRRAAVGADARLSVLHRHLLPRRCFPAACSAPNARRSSPSSPARPGTWPSRSTSRCAPCRATSTRWRAASGFTGWQRFWRLEAPFAMPGLIWNTMMSMSGRLVLRRRLGGDHRRRHHHHAAGHRLLSGARPSTSERIDAVVAAVADHGASSSSLYDQLLFRPVVAWAGKFRVELSAAQDDRRAPGCCASFSARAGLRGLRTALQPTVRCAAPSAPRRCPRLPQG